MPDIPLPENCDRDLVSPPPLSRRVWAALRRPIAFATLAPWAALLLPLFVYLFGFRFQGGGDSTPAELLPIVLFRTGHLDFRDTVSGDLPYWFASVRGRVVSAYPVLPGFLNVPLYAAAGLAHVDLEAHRRVLSGVNASIIAAVSVLFLYLALREIPIAAGAALTLSLTYALGTTVWSVASRAMLQHGPSVLFLSFSLWSLLRGGRAVAWAGLALGLAVVNRPTNLAIALPLAVYVLRYERKHLIGFLALAALPAAFHAWYAKTYWGLPWSLAQPIRSALFAGHPAAGLAGLLVSPSRGLLVFSPFFLVAIAGIARSLRPTSPGKMRLPRYLIVGTLLVLLVYSRWAMWWGGHSFGYRLVTEVAPLLIVLIGFGWTSIASSRPVLVTFFALAAASVYIHFLGAMVGPSGFNDNIDLEPRRLWSVRGSELVLSTRKFLAIVRGDDPFATRYAAPAVRSPAPGWWRPNLSDDSIPGWIDGPLDGASIEGPLEIAGWAKSAAGDVDVRVAIAPDGLAPAVERRPRPDVQSVMPQLGDCSRAGWRVVAAAPAPGVREHAVLVELKAPSGKVRLLGPIRIRWTR